MAKNQFFIKKVIKEMGGIIEKIIPERSCFYIKIKGEKIFVSRNFKIVSNPLAGKELTEFKDLTSLLLKEAGLPTPEAVCFYQRSLEKKDLEKKLALLSYPVVIKNSSGSNSQGVFANIASPLKAKKIILKEIKKFHSLVVQEMLFGKEYRVLVLKDKAIGVLEMIPPRVFGDGKNTVKKLIEKKWLKTKQKTPIDKNLKMILEEQGATLKSILKKNEFVYIKKNSCLAEGGEIKDVTEEINKEIELMCIHAAKIVGNYLVGIDLICENIKKGLHNQNLGILEINGRPDLYIHYNPTYGKTRNVIKDIVEFILKLKKAEKCSVK